MHPLQLSQPASNANTHSTDIPEQNTEQNEHKHTGTAKKCTYSILVDGNSRIDGTTRFRCVSATRSLASCVALR
jgi:hypothetical protein